MVVADLPLAVPEQHAHRITLVIDRAECDEAGHRALEFEHLSIETAHAPEPVTTDELGVEAAPSLEVLDRLGELLDGQTSERPPRVAAVMRAGRLLERDPEVHDVMVLVSPQSVAECMRQARRVIRTKRIRHENNTDDPSLQISQISRQGRPVAAAEQRVRSHGIAIGRPGGWPVGQESARARQGEGPAEFSQRGHISRTLITSRRHAGGPYQFAIKSTRQLDYHYSAAAAAAGNPEMTPEPRSYLRSTQGYPE